MEPAPYKRVAEVFYLTGYQIKLRPLETIEKVRIGDDMIAVLINTFEATESTTRYTVKKVGRRLISWEKRPNGSWFRDEVLIWDDERPDQIHYRHGSAELDDQKLRDQHTWEDACWRPGTARFPIDQAENHDSASWRMSQ